MQTIEYRSVVDKSSWPRGEWDDEPDKVQWQDEETGLPCLIVRGPIGALCGYVGVPQEHPWHSKSYDDCTVAPTDDDPHGWVDVHGGLTYSAACGHGAAPAQGICHIPGQGEPDNVWWLGFDCAHSGDLSPACRRDYLSERETYKNLSYTQEQVRRLAKQAAGASL